MIYDDKRNCLGTATQNGLENLFEKMLANALDLFGGGQGEDQLYKEILCGSIIKYKPDVRGII